MRQSAGQAPPYPYGVCMFEQFTTHQLYDLHSHLTESARHLHLAWAVQLKATGDPTNPAGDMSSSVGAMAALVYDELKTRHAKHVAETDAA